MVDWRSHKPSGGIDAGRLERLCGVKAVSGKLCEPMETLESPVVKVGESSLKVSALVALAGAEAVVRGDDGNVLLTCFSLGQGKVYFSPVPLEMVPVSESLMRSLYGRVLASSGVMTTRRPVDPETLMTYRVPGEGCTGWVFWNGGDEAVTVERGGHKLTVGAQRVGYLSSYGCWHLRGQRGTVMCGFDLSKNVDEARDALINKPLKATTYRTDSGMRRHGVLGLRRIASAVAPGTLC